MRCPIFTLAWTPEGRRLITGASSGEFTLWNGLMFNFETILQVSLSTNELVHLLPCQQNGFSFIFFYLFFLQPKAHDVSVRTMVWSHNDNWMVTGDHGGFVKYWQSNMNNVKMFQAHKDPIRGIRYSSGRGLAVAGSGSTLTTSIHWWPSVGGTVRRRFGLQLRLLSRARRVLATLAAFMLLIILPLLVRLSIPYLTLCLSIQSILLSLPSCYQYLRFKPSTTEWVRTFCLDHCFTGPFRSLIVN